MRKNTGIQCAFCLSLFNNTDRLWAAWSPESEDHKCGNSDLPSVGTEILRDQLCKAMEPDGILPRVLKELVDPMARLLSIIYQRSWESGEDPANRK